MDLGNSELYFIFSEQQKLRGEIHSFASTGLLFSQTPADSMREKNLLRCYLCIFPSIICGYSHVTERSKKVKKRVQQMAVSMGYISLIKS